MTTLREARDQGKLAKFIREHKNDAPADAEAFNLTVEAMAGKSREAPEASPPDDCDD